VPRKQRSAKGAAEYRFKIDAWTPDTLPMARLAEYMAELAQLLGERSGVHFRRLAKGSCVLIHKVDHEAIPKVRERIRRVRADDAPSDATKAFKAINKLLREDNATGVLRADSERGTIIRFPGREEAEEKFSSIRQHGSIDGIVVRVGGTDATVPVWLEVEDEQISGCYTTRAVAKQLGAKLFEPVRLFGQGRWSRDGEGEWSLVSFKVESFEALEDVPLTAAVERLRSIRTEWTDEAYAELGMIRKGPAAKPRNKNNGSH
jgi:hypothetical protein